MPSDSDHPTPEQTGPEANHELPLDRGQFSVSLRFLLLVVCLLALLLAALTPLFQRQRMRAAISRVKADQRSLVTAIESYFIDWMQYPPFGLTEGPARTLPNGTVIAPSGNTVHSWLPAGCGARRIFTFAMPSNFAVPHVLTTPVAYITAWPQDLFADTLGATFGYYLPPRHSTDQRTGVTHVGPGNRWVVTSFGPDQDENAPDGPGDLAAVVERVITDEMNQPTAELLDLVYDPSNGVWSNGDLVWIRDMLR